VARDYDTQLLESVSVRRRRLRDALLFGHLRSRRTLDENLVKVMAGVCVAAVACAGSVGWSFVRQQRMVQQRQQSAGPGLTTTPVVSPSPSLGGAETWGGKQVTPAMLDAALRKAGTPAGLYSLPGVHTSSSDGRYFLTRRGGRWTAGVAERGDRRLGPRFRSQDAACRWFYNELVFAEPAPARLTSAQVHRAAGHGAAIARYVERVLHPRPKPTPSPTPPKRGTSPVPSGSPKKTRTPKRPPPPPTSVVIRLAGGTVVDLTGEEGGSFLTLDGATGAVGHARRFEVEKTFLVRARSARTSMDGVELRIESGLLDRAAPLPSVRWLLHNGYLRRVVGT
jgi:hypothetical protein